MTEHTFGTHDGTKLFYRAWPAVNERGEETRADASVVLFHRGHEHSGRLVDVVEALRLTGTAVYAWDARGHGESPGERGYADAFADVVRDAEWFVRHLESEHGARRERLVAFGHSVGAVLVAAWIHDYAPGVAGMVLAAPAFRIRLYVPAAIPGLRLQQTVRRGKRSFIQSYVKPRMLTHDRREAQRYADDPKVSRQIAANVLLDIHDTGRRLVQDAGAITTPTLVLVAGSDWVVDTRAQQRFYDGLRSPAKRLRWFPGMYHDLLHEEDRGCVIDEARGFISNVLGEPAEPAAKPDDRAGFTREEYDRLRRPLPTWSPRRWGFQAQRAALRSVGRLSDGIALSWRTGFDSGRSLEYVYENRASGRLGVGKWIDRAYLNAVGWAGIRRRREHLHEALRAAMQDVRERGEIPHVLDIAAGCGRYVLDSLEADEVGDSTAELRDANVEALRAAAAAAEARGLTARVVTSEGDGLDGDALAAVEPRPDIAVVSGLYELFPENAPLRASLRGLYAALRPGGRLIYTGQPWHPQVEMIARCLKNRDDRRWVMRRRTTEELDALVRDAGFVKHEMFIDRWGIFTVSMAVKADATEPPGHGAPPPEATPTTL